MSTIRDIDAWGTHRLWLQKHGHEYDTAPCPDDCEGVLTVEERLGERLALACTVCTFTVSIPATGRPFANPDQRTEGAPF